MAGEIDGVPASDSMPYINHRELHRASTALNWGSLVTLPYSVVGPVGSVWPLEIRGGSQQTHIYIYNE